MLRIPYGQTRSYGALAAELASTARSVGQACGTNPISIIIPCHRVVGATGKMIGYSGFRGTATKEFLLGLEGAIAPPLPFDVARF
jgi:methylated-DNA-[protein]-cysteine S-methyltransferase